MIDLINTIDGRISIDGNKQKETKIVSFLKNLKGLGVVHFNRFKSNILELNKLEKGDTIQWPLGSFSFAYHRAIITELNIEPKIIHLYQHVDINNSLISTSFSSTNSSIRV